MDLKSYVSSTKRSAARGITYLKLHVNAQGPSYVPVSSKHCFVLLSSISQVKKLSEAPETHLSLHAVASPEMYYRSFHRHLTDVGLDRCSSLNTPSMDFSFMIKRSPMGVHIPELPAHY